MQDRPAARSESVRKRLVIAGASGSIGTALCRELSDDYEIVAVTHFEARAKMPEPDLPVAWRHCDFFSRAGMAEALAGADYAIYLVHTRLPSARLDQAQCEDMDVIIADNFARAASINGVRQTLCLRGLQPAGELPADVRRRRNEVVACLGAYGTPVTVIRASLIVAPGSTAVNLVGSQVSRSRLVPVPSWALSLKQPIAIDDLIRAIRHCIGNPEAFTGSFDVGGPEIMNWRQVLEQAAELQGTRPLFLPLRWMPRWAYAWWLRRRSPKTHRGTIRLLVEDLQYNSLARGNPLQRVVSDGAIQCREAIRPFLEGDDRARLVNPRSRIMGVYEKQLRESSSVRSIQRVMLPAGKDAAWIARTYFSWLQDFVWPFVACRSDEDGSYRLRVRGLGLTLLELIFQPDRSAPERRMYFITGGLLASGSRNMRGRMEFHDVPGGRHTIIAIHDFAPALPWNLYQATQATAHGIVMRAFQRHMSALVDSGM